MVCENQVRIRAVERRFPQGCKVRRKEGVPLRETAPVAEATVSRVVITGIFRDVFLKTTGYGGYFLDPDAYEVFK